LAIYGVTGSTVIVSSFEVVTVTVTVVDPEIPASSALIVAVDAPAPLTNPLVPVASPTGALVTSDELQADAVVKSCALPSWKWPVAVSCTVVPWAIEGLAGLIVMPWTGFSVAAVTVTMEVPVTIPRLAVIVVLAEFTPVTKPSLPALLLTVAVASSSELHCTELVISLTLLSEKCPSPSFALS
jgi:hypothetical protein